MKRIAVYPGTFDPITNGHIDIVQRACELFDEVIVTVAVNPSKDPMFTVPERLFLLEESLINFPTVKIDSFNGLIVEHAHLVNAVAIIRGLRAVSDFEFEFQMALMNRKLADDITTVFLMPNEKYTYLNSTIIRGLAKFKADVSEFVPEAVQKALQEKVENKQ
ncbi:MAG: pantetheine-phosphate adenylyltransferase [Ignavibacteria bacterium CG22_combo_CG10-13_8_21_14_all_37_15]|nr:MAG: pantetheine-phosphate adenylyltransferase [Ignavibacteria bacterium CG22_combo_CG10-13_8_21_14_all_37_15]